MTQTHRKACRLLDVAEAAGVSKATAAKVLLGTGGKNTRVSENVARQVREAAAELDYRPNQTARQLAGIRSQTLGLLIHHGNSPIVAERVFMMEEIASYAGYRMMIAHAHASEERVRRYLADFSSRGIDGIIALNFEAGDTSLCEEMRSGPPVVFQSTRPVDGPRFGWVRLDRAAGIRMAMDHLVTERNRRQLGIVLNSHTTAYDIERLDGFRRGLAVHRLPLRGERILAMDAVFDYSAVIRRLVDEQKVDAIIAASDLIAVALIKQLKAAGLRVPEDVAVTGFDNRESAAAIDLTTIDQENKLVAEATIDLVVKLIEQGPLESSRREIVVSPRLVVRATT